MASSRTLVKPVQIAKELGIKSQIVYGWIKSGKIKTYTQDGFDNMVDANDARALVNKKASKGPSKSGSKGIKVRNEHGKYEDVGSRSPVRPGDVLSWGAKEGRRIAQVTKEDEYLTTMRALAKKKTEELVWSNTSLETLIKEGKATLENPEELLRMVLFAWRSVGLFKQANDFAHLMLNYNIEAELYEDDQGEDGEIEDAPWIQEQMALASRGTH